MKLYVDMGNSCIKWSFLNDDSDFDLAPELQLVSESRSLSVSEWHLLVKSNQWLMDGAEKPVISKVLVSSVSQGESLAVLNTYLQQHFSVECIHQQSEKCWQSLKNAYANPARMGADRWLAMIAAWHKFHQACLVIDCGTAITIDAINAKGEHLGGHIVPGLQLLQKTLTGQTAQVKMYLDDERKENSTSLYGASTTDAVNLGCQFMVQDYIFNRWQQFHKVHQNGLLLITGGDGLTVATQLELANCYHKDLVLQGLYIRHE